MRGRRPRPLTLAADDVAILQMIARSRSRPWFQIQHARILLGVAAGQRVQTLALQMQCDAATVWRVCRSYEERGLDVVLREATRPGRPQQLSPPPARSDRTVGLPGANRQGVAHHPLDQFRLGSPGGQRRDCRRYQPPYRLADSARRRPATAPHSLLEDGSSGCGVQEAGRKGPVVLRKRRQIGCARALGRLRR